MIISQSGIVDIIPEYNRALRPIFCVSEGDADSRMINITVQNAGNNFSIPEGASVYVAGKKLDNTTFTYECSYSGYIVTFPITEQMSAVSGLVLCEIQIVVAGDPLGSANFCFWVEPSPIENGTTSESDLNIFVQAITDLGGYEFLTDEVAVLSARMDQFARLPDGSLSTAADAELADIRVMVDGKTASTAGDAVRTQITDQKNALWQNIRALDDGKRIFEMVWGNIAPDGTINYNYPQRVVNYTYEKFDKSTVLSLATGYGLILALYDDSYALISRTIYAGGNVITVPANTFFRVCVYHGTIVPSTIADLADKVTYTSDIQTEIETALTATHAITNGGIELTNVDDLNTAAASVIGGDKRVAFFRYTGSTLNIPNESSGFVIIYRAGTMYQTQIAMPTTGGLFSRNRLNGVWGTWQRIDSAPRVYHVEKDGSGDYTSLVECINEATQYMDSKVYVGAGEWDICAELGETYLNEVSSSKRGVYLKNHVHLIFASNSKVVCNYTGTREDTMRWLSPFNAGVYGFTLENANIEASNVRYCVHDERDQDTDAYVNKYINCRMHLDNSTNTVIRTCNPIGGGLGKNGYIDIDGCWFKGERTIVYTENLPLVTYHNSEGADAKSHIFVKNTYLADDGRFRFNWYGQSQLITDVEVSGCSMGSSILSRAEVEGSSPYQNISIIEWNNTVRA